MPEITDDEAETLLEARKHDRLTLKLFRSKANGGPLHFTVEVRNAVHKENFQNTGRTKCILDLKPVPSSDDMGVELCSLRLRPKGHTAFSEVPAENDETPKWKTPKLQVSVYQGTDELGGSPVTGAKLHRPFDDQKDESEGEKECDDSDDPRNSDNEART